MHNRIRLFLHRKERGSIMIFSLIILSFLLIAGLSLAAIAIVDHRSASSTDRSTVAFQAADSAAEIILQKMYKKSFTTLGNLCSDISGCTCDDGVLTGPLQNMVSTYRVTFFDNDKVRYSDTGCSASSWRQDVVYMKSEGKYGNATRAIQLVVKAP